MAFIHAMSVHECHDSARYAVLTRLGDSWIFRAALTDRESAEAEAFRWRRIYGPGRTLVASLGQFAEARRPAPASNSSRSGKPQSTLPPQSTMPMVIDVEAEVLTPPLAAPIAANDDIRQPAPPLPIPPQPNRGHRGRHAAKPLGWSNDDGIRIACSADSRRSLGSEASAARVPFTTSARLSKAMENAPISRSEKLTLALLI